MSLLDRIEALVSTFPEAERVIETSYRLVAPKALGRRLDGSTGRG